MKKFGFQLLGTWFVLLCSSAALAQDIKLQSGVLGFLKGQERLNTEYAYDGLMVGKMTEQEYMQKKVAEFNAKQSGTGDKWLASWKADRATRFEPKFEELLNKQFESKKIALKAEKSPEAKFTLVLKTTVLDPGWNAAIMRRPAEVSTRAEFYEGKDRSNPLAVITLLKAPGRDAMGFDFDVGYRFQEGYAKTGKELGIFLYKKALK